MSKKPFRWMVEYRDYSERKVEYLDFDPVIFAELMLRRGCPIWDLKITPLYREGDDE